jgi:hypothetical protein
MAKEELEKSEQVAEHESEEVENEKESTSNGKNFKDLTSDFEKDARSYKGGEGKESGDEETEKKLWQSILKRSCLPSTIIFNGAEAQSSRKSPIVFDQETADSAYIYDYRQGSRFLTKFYLSQKERSIATSLGLSANLELPKELTEIADIKLGAELKDGNKTFTSKTTCYFSSIYTDSHVLVSVKEERLRLSQEFVSKLREILSEPKQQARESLLELFKSYGYIVPLQFYIGGAKIYEAQKEFESTDQASEAKRNIEMGLKALETSIEAGVKTDQKTQEKVFANVALTDSRCIGGDKNQQNLGLWLGTLKDSKNYQVTGFGVCKTVLDFLPPDSRDLKPKVLDLLKEKLDLVSTKNLQKIGGLEARTTVFGMAISSIDNLSGIVKETKLGDKDLGVWKPSNSTNEWYWVGHYAQPSKSSSEVWGGTIIIRPLIPDAIAKPEKYQKLWSYNTGNLSKFSGQGTCISCWKIVPPVGYCALGYLMLFDKLGEDEGPSENETKNLVCVKQELVEAARISDQPIWKSMVRVSSPLRSEMSLWSIVPANQETAYNSGTFIVGEGHDKPRNIDVWCLKKSDLIRVISF